MLYLVAVKSDNDAARAEAGRWLASISDTYWNEFDGVWFVKSDRKAVEIRNELSRLFQHNDRIVVAFLTGFAAWHGFDAISEEWLVQHM